MKYARSFFDVLRIFYVNHTDVISVESFENWKEALNDWPLASGGESWLCTTPMQRPGIRSPTSRIIKFYENGSKTHLGLTPEMILNQTLQPLDCDKETYQWLFPESIQWLFPTSQPSRTDQNGTRLLYTTTAENTYFQQWYFINFDTLIFSNNFNRISWILRSLSELCFQKYALIFMTVLSFYATDHTGNDINIINEWNKATFPALPALEPEQPQPQAGTTTWGMFASLLTPAAGAPQ